VFAAFQIKSLLTVFERNLCHVVARRETLSQFTPMIGVYYLLQVPREIKFFDEKRRKCFVTHTNK